MAEATLPTLKRDTLFFGRLVVGVAIGGIITLTLFWVMQYLIETADRSLDDSKRGSMLDFVRVKRQEVVERRQVKPKKPPPPKAPPPEPPAPKLDQMKPNAEKMAISAAPVETEIDLAPGGFSLGIGEGDYLPIVKVQPIYPQRALSRGAEGDCIVEFTVTKSGTTRDAFAVDGQCDRLFEKSSVQAALKFKYKPRVRDGEAVEVPGVRNKFTYKLED